MFTSFVTIRPFSRTATRPAADRGRSSQVEQSIPPYFSTLSWVYIPADCTGAVSLILKLGESLCPAIIIKPGSAPPGRFSAMMDEPFLRT